MLDHLLRRRGIARAAVAVLTIGLAALAVLAVWTNARAVRTTERIRTIQAAGGHWDRVFLHVATEYEALADYVGANSTVGRQPLASAVGSADADLAWLAHSPDAHRVVTVEASYRTYTESLRQVIAAGNRGDRAAVRLYADQATLSASTTRKLSAAGSAMHSRELARYLTQVDRESRRLRVTAIGLGSADVALLALCALILLGYQRRIERQAADSSYRALHDGLTGIPNRTLFGERLDAEVVTSARTGTGFGLLLLDLDRFKEVNDTLGHQHGDTLLCEVADRLSTVVRSNDIVARLGGDEFAILLPGLGAERDALDVADRIRQALTLPVQLDSATVEVDCSVGVAIHPRHGSDPAELLKHADIAMYVAKRDRLGTSVYSPDADQHSTDALALGRELRQALGSDELVLHYQPKADAINGRVTGVEALVRWQHPVRGQLLPGDFIPLAERNRLIVPLTDEVIGKALDQVRDWLAEGLRMPVAVNLDAVSLLDPQFPDRVDEQLRRTGVPPRMLTLEITENGFLSDAEAALTGLYRLRELGVRLALDDFGTGYSAMGYLQRMPLDELKIDRRFITHLTTAPQDRAIAAAVIGLAHALQMEVVAEGVEDAAALVALGELDCDQVQGYHLCRPVPVQDLRRWLDGRATADEQGAAGPVALVS